MGASFSLRNCFIWHRFPVNRIQGSHLVLNTSWIVKRRWIFILKKPFHFSHLGQVTLLFVGDVSFAGPVKYYVEHDYHTYNDSFNEVAPYIRQADIAVANLESPFVSKDVYRYKYKGKRLVFLDSSPKAAPALR